MIHRNGKSLTESRLLVRKFILHLFAHLSDASFRLHCPFPCSATACVWCLLQSINTTTALPRAVSRPVGCCDRTEDAFYKAARNGSVDHLISHEIQRRILVAKRRSQAVLWLAGYSGHKRQRCLQSSGRYKAYQAPGRHTGRYVTSAYSIITLFNIACRALIECSRPFAHGRCYRRQD